MSLLQQKTGGFIDTRLKTLRKSQSPSKRKRCTPKKPRKCDDSGSKRMKAASAVEINESSLYKVIPCMLWCFCLFYPIVFSDIYATNIWMQTGFDKQRVNFCDSNFGKVP